MRGGHVAVSGIVLSCHRIITYIFQFSGPAIQIYGLR